MLDHRSLPFTASVLAPCLPFSSLAQETTVLPGETITDAVDLEGAQSLVVSGGGTVSVDGDAVRLRSPASAVAIINDGLIESVEENGRAIDEAGDPMGDRFYAITNEEAGIIRSEGDAIRIDSDIADGTVSLVNARQILATAGGQGIDFNSIGPAGTGSVTIENLASGVIQADAADGVRPGDGAVVINRGVIRSDGVIGDSHDGVDWQDDTGHVVNADGGLITRQRHGITADEAVDVLNEVGGTIVGRNGAGIDSDGTGRVVNFGAMRGEYVAERAMVMETASTSTSSATSRTTG